ncbi:MAG: RNA polymerase sigma factor [Spongiibacteraceae bacterium]|nr:RNA polymerase sigma factor [Spongiibacteraceae bacterium]
MNKPVQLKLDALYENHFALIINKLRRIVGCHRVAEDLAQEAYLRVSNTLTQRPVEYLQPYLYQTARNLALDYLRKERTRQGNNPGPQESLHSNSELKAPDDLASTLPSPEQAAIASEQIDRLQAALDGLPERRREILILSKIHRWRYQDIAEHFGITTSAVEKSMKIALAHCMKTKLD